MLTVKDVIGFLQTLPPEMEVPAILAKIGGADYLNLAFERQAVEDRQQQVQKESDEACASYTSYNDAHRNVPVESDLFMETQVVGDDLLSVFVEAESRAAAIRKVLETCIEAFVDSHMALLNKVEAEIAQLPQYGGRRRQ